MLFLTHRFRRDSTAQLLRLAPFQPCHIPLSHKPDPRIKLSKRFKQLLSIAFHSAACLKHSVTLHVTDAKSIMLSLLHLGIVWYSQTKPFATLVLFSAKPPYALFHSVFQYKLQVKHTGLSLPSFIFRFYIPLHSARTLSCLSDPGYVHFITPRHSLGSLKPV